MRPSGATLLALGGLICLAAGASGAADAVRPAPAIGEAAQGVDDQLTRGKVAYGLNCISCHANRLQGLTDEWRATWVEDHQDCWQSKCHSFNHPPDGFMIPRFAPPLREAMLVKYATASDLFDFISTEMPYQEPGVLTAEKYWDIEAYILHENGLRWGDEALGPENAPSVLLRAETETGNAPPLPAMPSASPVPPPTLAAATVSQPPSAGTFQPLLVLAGGIGLFAAAGGVLLWRTRGKG